MIREVARQKFVVRFWQGAVWAAVVALLAGCASVDRDAAAERWSFADASARVKYLAPGFELQHLIEGKLAIGGISGLGRDEVDCQWEVSQLLVDGLGIRMPALEVISLDDVRDVVTNGIACSQPRSAKLWDRKARTSRSLPAWPRGPVFVSGFI